MMMKNHGSKAEVAVLNEARRRMQLAFNADNKHDAHRHFTAVEALKHVLVHSLAYMSSEQFEIAVTQEQQIEGGEIA